jgi:signal transduction histidine kinase
MSVSPGESPNLLDVGKAYVGATGLFSAKGGPQMNLHIAIPESDLFPGQRRYAFLTFLAALVVVLGVAWTLLDLHNRVIRPMRQLAEEIPSPSIDTQEPMNFNSDIWELQRVGEKLHLAGRADHERKRLLHHVEHSQRVESVGMLAPGIVHDVNNQLTMVLGQITICRTLLEAHPELQPHLHAAEGATIKCGEVLRALMDYSRPDHGRRELLSLNVVVEGAASLLRRVLGHSIQIEEDLARDIPLLFGEPVKLQQVLVNLGLNARDAMPDGGQLLFRTFRAEERVCLEVKDTGCGMPEEVRQRIFEPFFTTKEPKNGTGLGLAMVANIVAAHGGIIQVESAQTTGTQFKIEFPPSLRKQTKQRV